MPQSNTVPYLPSVIGKVPGSVHQVLSHCYNVHPWLSTHHPMLYPYQSSIPTLQNSFARILLHRVGGCNPCTWHIDTPLNPTSNFGRLLHLWHPCPWRWGVFIFMWAPSSWCHLPLLGHQDLSDLSDLDDIDEAIDNKLQSLTKPLSGKDEGNWGDWGLWSLWHLLHSWPLEGWQVDSWQLEPPSPDASFRGKLLGGSNQKGCWAGRFTQWCPGPLTLTQWSDMAWAMALLSSWIVMGSMQGQTDFPTHVPAPVSRNVASLALSAVKLSHWISPTEKNCPTWAVTTASVSPVLAACSISSMRVAIQEWEGGGTAPILLSKSHVFLNNVLY